MSTYKSHKYDGNLIVSVAPEACIIPAVAVLSSIGALVDSTWARAVSLALIIIVTFIIVWFFRSPTVDKLGYHSLAPDDIVAPSYGTVAAIDTVNLADLQRDYGDLVDMESLPIVNMDTPVATRIVSFLSVLDVHVQCAPVDGVIGKHLYYEGSFHPAAFLEKSRDNERCMTTFTTQSGKEIYVVLIAGLLARKIMIFPEYDDGEQKINRGDKYAIIKFGSRVDTIIPAGYKINIKIGDSLTGGSTVLAYAPQVQGM